MKTRIIIKENEICDRCGNTLAEHYSPPHNYCIDHNDKAEYEEGFNDYFTPTGTYR